jgi:hypothetical protein
MRKIICGLLAIVGVFVAVETKDGIEYELLIRGIGVVVFAICNYLGGWWDLTSEGTQKAKTENTQKTPKTPMQ